MEEDAQISLQAAGRWGACANNYLMQFQSNILNVDVERPT